MSKPDFMQPQRVAGSQHSKQAWLVARSSAARPAVSARQISSGGTTKSKAVMQATDRREEGVLATGCHVNGFLGMCPMKP